MITVVVGKEIEKLKGEFESVINGMNMVGEIPYDVYSKLFDVGAECIQKAYELGKAELEKENAELQQKFLEESWERTRLTESLKHFNSCCEWNDDVHACEYMVRAPEYARGLEEAKRIVRFLLEYGRYEWIDPNSKEFEAFFDVKEKAKALVGGEQ